MKLFRTITSTVISALVIVNTASASASVLAASPTEISRLSDETLSFYDHWKSKYLVKNPYSHDETQYYVFYGDESYAQAHHEVPVTVSEAHGYGMLIAASMADYDSEAKEIFDGMYRYYKAYPSSIGPNLMAWQQSDNGSALVNSNGADSATDGDLDIAYALLMADRIWGSSGVINYKKAAIDAINDIMKYDVNQEDWLLRLGDWAYDVEKGDKYYSATRSSDFIVQYMPVFAEVTGDDRWLKLYDGTYSIINSITDTYGTGILPDFIIKDKNGSFVPAPANFLESENDGNYYYNSCRTPWRISMDYLINKNADAKKFADALTSFIIKKTGGDPWEIMAGYTPKGEAVSDWNDLCFDSPFIIAAACTENKSWHDEVRKMCLECEDEGYYGDTITMLCLIVDDGGWIVPESKAEPVMGDVNCDGVFNIADVTAVQKWLLNSSSDLKDWKAANFIDDQRLDVFDLCAMKRALLRQQGN